ncbi:syntaxin binding protein 1 [Massospora cicadina]|nr:syntaxin binding protein 1 [Massospora cicadina]
MDARSREIFSSVCQDFDLLSENVTAIENIISKRGPATNLLAVYFLIPTAATTELLLEDFTPTPKYQAAKVFFLAEPSTEILRNISASSASKLIEPMSLNINYFPFESRVFTFREPDAFFKNLFIQYEARAEIAKISEKLLSVCISLGENPVVRLKSQISGNSFEVTVLTWDLAKGEHFPGKECDAHPDRATDLYAPLLHELTYQALVTDLLGLEDGKIYRHAFVNALGKETEENIILDETDPIWSSMRHMHIADCIRELLAVSDNPAAVSMLKRRQDGQNASLKDMRDIVASVPELQELSKKYSAHMDIAGKCMELLKGLSLDSAIDCEQNLVTGVTSDGEPVKNALADMAPLLTGATLSSDDKLRLLMLYSLSRQGDYDRKRLEAHANLTETDRAAITNLTFLSFNKPVTKPKEVQKLLNPFRRTVNLKDEEENPYALSRYVPQVKKIVQDQISKAITSEEFPLVKEHESKEIKNPVRSLRVNKPTWQKKSDAGTFKTQGGRILVFVAGGLTYSEIRSVYEISKVVKRDVYIGTTHILTPKDFLASLRDMKPQTLPRRRPSSGTQTPLPSSGTLLTPTLSGGKRACLTTGQRVRMGLPLLLNRLDSQSFLNLLIELISGISFLHF